MTTRRGFLGSILAAGFAPAAIGSGVLMPVRKMLAQSPALVLWGDGIHDDSEAFQAWVDGRRVLRPDGSVRLNVVQGEHFATSRTIDLRRGHNLSILDSRFSWIGEGERSTLLYAGFDQVSSHT